MANPSDTALLECLAERTLALCAARSPIGEEAALCSLLEAEQGRHWPGAVQRIGNSLVLGRVTGGRPVLSLFGHLDTVPLQPARWSAAPPTTSYSGRTIM